MNMTATEPNIEELHLQLGLLQMLDVGLIVLDKDYTIYLWNTFMENHSGLLHSRLYKKNLFECFSELPATWFRRKIESVFTLKNRSFITWEQRPYLFHFKSYRPITGNAPHMFQNVTLIPLSSPDGQVNHVGILIYDVTDAAMGRKALEKANGQLEKLSRTDALTGLFNRGFWESQMLHEFNRFARTQSPSTLIMVDIDHFKRINDTYGHPAGDEVIRQLSACLQAVTRNTDIVGRYGGEEFALLLVDTKASHANILVNRLRDAVDSLAIPHLDESITFTLSMGMVEISNLFQTYEQWIQLADQALYQSKQNGRNRVTVLSMDE